MIVRGAVVIGAGCSGVGGKPRPWLVIQADAFNDTHGSVTCCMISVQIAANGMFRIAVDPSSENGLKLPSVVAIDVILSLSRRSIEDVAGHLAPASMLMVDEALRRWLDL